MSMKIHNFSAGPAQLPESVLLEAQEELLDWQGTGISILELGHRTEEFLELRQQIEADLRDLLSIPDSHEVLFYSSGATQQMALIPFNLLGGYPQADYLITGHWSNKAAHIAADFCQINNPCPTYDPESMALPEASTITVADNSAYLYYCDNETIEGIEFSDCPDTELPLISDMTSNILSRPINFLSYGCIFAGFQKNIGPAGMSLVIVEKELLERARPVKPDLMNYYYQAEKHSVANTPAVFQWYMAGLMFDYLQQQGGVIAMHKLAKKKSSLLYRYIDQSDMYHNPVRRACRSRVNVPFFLTDESLNDSFLQQSTEAGLVGLKGHRSRGGLRASLYNAVTLESVEILLQFMREFEKQHG